MTILETLVVAFIGGAAAAIVNGIVELRKREPKVIDHGCRILGTDVYTYIKGDKKQTPPLCLYLDPTDHVTCKFTPDNPNAQKMKALYENKCYIAHFNSTNPLN